MQKDENLKSIICSIFKKRSGIDFSKNIELENVKLLGGQIYLPPRELVLILYDIEKKLGIKIAEEEIAKGKFDCYSNIVEIVSNTIKGK